MTDRAWEAGAGHETRGAWRDAAGGGGLARPGMDHESVGRRAFLGRVALCGAAWLAGARGSAQTGAPATAPHVGAAVGDADLAGRLTLLLQEYDRQGVHRTGSRGDTASAQSLTTGMQRWRLSGTLERFPFERVDVASAYVQFRARRIDGVPLFDGTFTEAVGVTGGIGLPGDDTAFVLLDSDDPAFPTLRRGDRYVGVVLVTRGPREGLVLRDVDGAAPGTGAAVLQVSSEERDWLREQAGTRPDVKLVVEATRTPAEGYTMVARLRGRDPQALPLLVSAPRGTWFRGTGERGSSIACLAEILRAMSAMRPARDCVFVSAGGAELGMLGLHHLLAKQQVLPRAHAWICLGPHLGVPRTTARVRGTTEPLERMVAEAVAGEAPVASVAGADAILPSEPAALVAAGAPVVALWAEGNPLARTAADRLPDAVNAAHLAAQTRLAITLATRLAGA